jgi:uncharacterized protein YndB with AHSA1/START domain
MVPEQIEREMIVAAPIERVWEILTQPEHFQRWFAFDGATIDLRPGGEIVMRWQEHGTFYARVEEVDPPQRFSYRGARLPDDPVDVGNATLVTFTLSREGQGTRLRVVESGFRDLDVLAEVQAETAEGNIAGWHGAFSTLEAYVQELGLTASAR